MRLTALAFMVVVGCSTDAFITPDGSTSDASLGDGGPSEDSPTNDACQSAPACAPPAVCTTFDTTNPYGAFTTSTAGVATLALTTIHAVTCPNSMMVTLGANAATTDHATISYNYMLAGGGNTSTVETVLVVDAWLPTTVTGDIMFVRVAANAIGVALRAASTGYYVYVEAEAAERMLPAAPVLGAWNHITLDVTFAAMGGMVKLVYDTPSMPQQTGMWSANTLGSTTSVVTSTQTQVGMTADDPVASMATAYYDDVTFTPM